ncbi:MAG: CapA family protein [Clostridiales bacterium]|nr:CapA family protein [Clostridiales bacterium]
MKKIVCILACVFMVCVLPSCEKEADTAMQPQPTENTGITTIKVSCAGDCTLASDESFSGGTFEDVLSANDNDYTYFFKNVKSIFEEDDITIVNFEGTLSENGERADKTFAFRGDPENVNILKEGSVEAVTLANNHSKDYGDVSLEDTKDILSNAGIEYAINSEIATLNIKGVNVAVIGLYQLDGSADSLVSSVMAKAADADLKIVQIHWGVEKAAEPSEEQINLAHTAIDKGADLVIGHHPHVLQGVEKYKGRYICYSLGNFCFGGNPNPSDTDTMIFTQTFSFKEGNVAKNDDYEIIPCSITSSKTANNYQPTPLQGDEKERVEEKIRERSKNLGDGKLDLKFR